MESLNDTEMEEFNVTQKSYDAIFRQPDPAYSNFQNESRFWVNRVFVPITVIIGVIGNVVTIVVLTRRRMRSSTYLYLTALATSDVLYLIFSFTLSLDHYPNMRTFAYSQYYAYGHMITDACSNTSVWLTVSFTLERYIAVCHPIRGKGLCTESRAKAVIIGVWIFCFICTLPTPFEYTVVERWNERTNTTYYTYGHSELGKNITYQAVFYWFTTILFIGLPFTLIAIFNSFLIHAVHESKLERRKMTSVRGDRQEQHTCQENKITIMLIAVVFLFMICQVPTSVILILYANRAPEQGSNEEAILLGLGNICNLLMAINASCNFVLYCAFSDKYRKTFLITFLPCWYKPPSPIHTQSVYFKSTTDTISRSPSSRSGRSVVQRTPSTQGRDRPSGGTGNNQKKRYLTVPNGEPPGNLDTVESSEEKNTPTKEAPKSRKSIMMCFRLPKGPLKILETSKQSSIELQNQTLPLTTATEHSVVVTAPDTDCSDKLSCL